MILFFTNFYFGFSYFSIFYYFIFLYVSRVYISGFPVFRAVRSSIIVPRETKSPTTPPGIFIAASIVRADFP